MENISCSIIDQQIELIKNLCRSGQYWNAYHRGVAFWGSIDNWQLIDQKMLLKTILERVGLSRQSDFLRYSIYRKNPNHNEAALSVAYLFLYLRGPAFAWDFAERYLNTTEIDLESRSEWICFQSLVASKLRDFDEAERRHKQAANYAENTWWKRVKAYLLFDQEKFYQSAELMRSIYYEEPSEACLLQFAHTLCFIGDDSEAISLLEKEAPNYQSIRPWLTLINLYKNKNEVDKFEKALIQANQWIVKLDKNLSQTWSMYSGYVELAKKNYNKAKEYFSLNRSQYAQILAQNIEKGTADRQVKLDVPFVKQKFLSCAPASISAVLGYFGLNFSQDAIAEEICFNGTPDYLQHQWLKSNNIDYIEFDLEWEIAKALIDRDLPFCLVTRSGRDSHMQVVTGYHERTGILFVMDPSVSAHCEMLARETIASNASVGPRCMLILPDKEYANRIDFALPSQDIYVLANLFHHHLRSHNIQDAQKVLIKMRDRWANHRLTLFAERSLAIYLQDESAIEISTTQLLDVFPNETWLIVSKYHSLLNRGKRQEALELIFKKYIETQQYELLEVWFLEVYQDPRYKIQIKQYVSKLHRMALYYSESNWIAGHLFWHQGDHDRARRYYRWAVTLNDTDERYAESYFKSCLWNGSEQLALDFLESRWLRYQKKNSGPAISLYNALSILDKEHQGLSILKKNYQYLPKDEVLVAFYLRKLVQFGDFLNFRCVYLKSKSCLSYKERGSLLAEYYYAMDKHDLSEKMYLNLIKKNPQEKYFYERLFNILQVQGMQSKIDASLDRLLELFGVVPFSVWLVIEWHSDRQLVSKILQAYIKEFPNDYQAVERYARLLLSEGDADKINGLVEEYLNNNYRSSSLLAILSALELNNHNLNKAQQLAWQAINLNIDSDEAFDALLKTHWGADTRKNMLLTFWEMLSRVNSNGGALWNFWHAARNWMDARLLDEFCSFISNNYEHLWFSYVLCAKQKVDEDKLEEAKVILHKAEEKFPLLPRLHFELGEIYCLLKEPNRAIQYFEMALKLSPSWTLVARRLADLLDRLGELEQALFVLEKACRYDFKDGILYGLRADILLRQGKDEEAIQLLERAVTLEPSYYWAWNTLQKTAHRLGKLELVFELANQLIRKSPKVSGTWIALARMKTDLKEVESILLKGLKELPLDTSLHQELIELYITQERFDCAQKQINADCWKGNIPSSIMVFTSSILAQQGWYGEAISWLENYLKDHPWFYDGWSKLHKWCLEFRLFDKAVNAAKALVKIDPHRGYNLSICAETLMNHGTEKDKRLAAKWLEKAFYLEPGDSHVSLSWLDYLLDNQRLEEAESCEAIIARFYQHPLLDVRRLIRHSMNKDVAMVEALIQQIVDQNYDNTWVYFELFKWSLTDNKHRNLLNLLLKAMDKPSCCSAIAEVWSYQSLRIQGTKPILNYLNQQRYSEVWDIVVYQYFKYLEHNGKLPAKTFVSKHEQAIKNNNNAFGLYGFLLCQNKKYKQALQWYQTRDLSEINLGYIWYHKSWCQMELNDWNGAKASILNAFSCSPDSCYSSILLWYVYFKVLSSESLKESDLININQNELTLVEKYIFVLVDSVYNLQNTKLSNDSHYIWDNLRRANSLHQSISESRLAKHCKKQMQRILKQYLDESRGWWKNAMLRFKFANHF
jgi:tetratricopeptide (TPR) repeat protein